MARFPSLKARQLLRVLTSKPLGYRIVRQSGSHRRLEASGRPPITFSFRDRQTIRPRLL
jgi:predicted RNA binding protein YcfA (HicA-like mRNA interferase family)